MGKDHRKGKRIPLKAVVKRYRRVVNAAGRRILLHRERAEIALGRPLPHSAQVHHVDGTTGDNSPLVICQDAAYHKLLHLRARIVAVGGNPDTDKICSRCKVAKHRSCFAVATSQSLGVSMYCRPCAREYQAQLTRQHREAAISA